MMQNSRTAIMSLVVGMSLGFLVTGVQAASGNLEPPGSAVDNSGDPVATTQTQPSWDQALSGNERFTYVLNQSAGVLDKETGLVWESFLPANPVPVWFWRCRTAIRSCRLRWWMTKSPCTASAWADCAFILGRSCVI